MLAAFLKTVAGGFDYGSAIGAVLFTVLIFISVWVLYGALKMGRIPFGFIGRYVQSKIYWFERDKNPTWYWLAFSVYSLMTPFCIWTVYALCTGFYHKPD
jgi:hypothetical protein